MTTGVPEWRTRGLPDATGREPGPCLPSADPVTLAFLRHRLGDGPRLPAFRILPGYLDWEARQAAAQAVRDARRSR